MARVLVTGASGFIGLQLVEALLNRGDDVRCLVRSTSQVEPLVKHGVQLAHGDVTDRETLPGAVANVDVVYHLAGLTAANRLADYCRVNECGVQNIVQACAARTTPPTFVLVSSLAAAGPVVVRDRPRVETDPPQPVSRYGQSKRAGELAADARAGDVPITIVRPPIVLGPGDRTGAAMFRNVRRFRSFVVTGLGRRLSVVYVADLAAALIAAADRGERLSGVAANPGRGYYFVAAAERPTFGELARLVARSVNRPYAWPIPLPLPALWIVGGIGETIGHLTGRARYVNLDRLREVAAGDWICSSEKAQRDLQFIPGAPLEERIEQTTQWYKQHGWI
jgi:nucleoside-diphosphate-sugar epimerase